MALTPPSTNSISPAMNSDSSETRNRITRARSIGTPGRPTRLTTGRLGSNSSLPTGEPILLGTTPFTRIRYGASCTASERVKFATPPCATICRATCWLIRNGPVSVTAITLSHCSLVISRTCLLSEIAALLMRMSMRPHSATISFTSLAMSASLATSVSKAAATPPACAISAATLSPRPWSMSTTATLAPSDASSLAVSSPMLRPAPVTMATWSLSFIAVSAFQHGDAARPAGRGGRDLDREAAHLEAEGGKPVEVGELLHMAIADLTARLMALPDDAGIAGLGEALAGEREWRIPAPAVDSRYPHALFQQVQGRGASHAAALVDEVRAPVGRGGGRVHQHDVEWFELIADAIELALHVVGGADISVRLGAEVELHPVGQKPFQRDLVDLERRLAAVHRAVEMPRRIEMRSVVRGDRHPLDRRALAVGELLRFQPGKHRGELFCPLGMIAVGDLGQHARRVRGNPGFERDRKIDDTHVSSRVQHFGCHPAVRRSAGMTTERPCSDQAPAMTGKRRCEGRLAS